MRTCSDVISSPPEEVDGSVFVLGQKVGGVEFDCIVENRVGEERRVRRRIGLREELARHGCKW
jgi:hypothetical protein